MPEKYYLTVDLCPLRSWRLANEGDLTALRVNQSDGTPEQDLTAWEDLYNDFIQKVGLSQEFEEFINLMKEKVEAINDFVQTRERFKLNRIEQIDAELLVYRQTAGKGLTIEQVLPRLTDRYKVHFRERDLTVLDYFNLIKNI
jgi:hypothetical protein